MKEMNTPVDMMVFDYNPSGEKKAHMSPLDSIKYHRRFMQTGILAIDPKTGEIKTWVGGINNKYFQFDHIGSSRQVGSTFKPFIYATAITLQGISPCFPVVDQPYTIGPGDGNFGMISSWTPKNADGKYTGRTYTLFEGLKDSRNTVSVFLMQQLGNVNVVRGLVHNMGIDSSLRRSDGEYRVPNQPSICLGAADLSVMEMTGAYCTFANNGVFVKPYFVASIEDPNGKVIYRAIKEEQVALPPKANAVMVDMLKYAADYAFKDFKSEVGGKTGTTNDYVDGWFMGVTPSLVVGTWVGGEDPWIKFNTLADGQGAVMARPFFKAFLQRLENSNSTDYDPNAKFEIPVGGLDIETDCAKYNAMRYQKTGEGEFSPDKIYEEEFIEN
jgi:penicillin-binding protein 1A